MQELVPFKTELITAGPPRARRSAPHATSSHSILLSFYGPSAGLRKGPQVRAACRLSSCRVLLFFCGPTTGPQVCEACSRFSRRIFFLFRRGPQTFLAWGITPKFSVDSILKITVCWGPYWGHPLCWNLQLYQHVLSSSGCDVVACATALAAAAATPSLYMCPSCFFAIWPMPCSYFDTRLDPVYPQSGSNEPSPHAWA